MGRQGVKCQHVLKPSYLLYSQWLSVLASLTSEQPYIPSHPLFKYNSDPLQYKAARTPAQTVIWPQKSSLLPDVHIHAPQDNQLIRAGQWWRFITPVALHANLLHLVCNNHALNNLGPLMERLSGRQRFISVYTVSAVAGSVASFLFNSSPSVGASGWLHYSLSSSLLVKPF